MKQDNKLEVKGRLLLWATAIAQSGSQLQLANRAGEAFHQSKSSCIDPTRAKAFQDFAKSQPDYKAGTQKLSHISAFDELNPIPFPTLMECHQVRESCTMLAVIFFCQVLNKGYKEPGVACGNTQAFVDEHLTKIAAKVFPDEQTLHKFNTTKKQLIVARNTMLGHADATSFQISHKENMTVMKMHSIALKDIDIKEWMQMVELLYHGTLQYAREIMR